MKSSFPPSEDVSGEYPGVPLLDDVTGKPMLAPWRNDLEIRRLDLGGTYLAYVEAGEGEPVVLIPGFAGTISNFAPQIDALSDQFRVLSFDPMGAGFSDHPSISYAPRDHFRFARRFIEKLRTWPAVIVGHSMGGSVAYALAAENPELVRALVLITPRVPVPSRTLRRERAFEWAVRRFPRATESMTARAMAISAGLSARRITRSGAFANPVPVRDALVTAARKNGWPRASARTAMHLPEWHEWSGRLREIEVPTMVIWGERDRTNPIRNAAEISIEVTDAELFAIAGAGHMPTLEEPESVSTKIRSFISETLNDD